MPNWLFRLLWRFLGATHRQRVVDNVLSTAAQKHPEWSSTECKREALRIFRGFDVDLTGVRLPG